jgi:hypothetical protein
MDMISRNNKNIAAFIQNGISRFKTLFVRDDSCYHLSREWGLNALKIRRFKTLFARDGMCYRLSAEWGLNALKISRFKTLFEA